jgi:peptide/nickel transport system ATP-binding protein
MDKDCVLELEELRTHFFTRAGVIKAVDGVSLKVSRGEVLGIAGESGSGKSVTAFSLLGLVDPPGRVISGHARFDGKDLLGCDEESLRQIRGYRIAMIFQDPMMTLNPLLRIEDQMMETIFAHEKVGKAEAHTRSREALEKVGISDAAKRLKAYPHQFSGGMRQRVSIAIALLHKPDLIIADEPTTALDVTIQGQILYEMRKLCDDLGMALIWISHDLAVLGALADRISVMYAGRVVESGKADEVLDKPAHPYTKGLIGSVPGNSRRGKELQQIPGMPPNMLKLPQGCSFRPRCPKAGPGCEQEIQMTNLAGREFRCIRPEIG